VTRVLKAAHGIAMTAKVTVEEVERVAELAHLELKPEETPAMLRDLNAILDYVAQLNELDTTGVTPLAQVSELLCELQEGGGRGPRCARICACRSLESLGRDAARLRRRMGPSSKFPR